MKSMDERYALIRKALTGGKKMLLQEIAAAIDEDKSRTRTALERMCELGQVYREGGGLRGIKAVYFLAPVLEVQTESQDKAEVSTEPECQAKKKSPDAAGGIWASDIDKMRERVQVGDTVTVQVSDTIEKSLTLHRKVKVISKHRHLVRVTGGHSITYADLVMFDRGVEPDWRQKEVRTMMIEKIGTPAMLEQMAEEAAELAQAALKLARIMRGENPTPVTELEAWKYLVEEYTDVYQCAMELVIPVDWAQISEKEKRFKERWKERENGINSK